MRVADILLLYDYNHWARELIMGQVVRLTPEEFAAERDSSRGGVRSTLAHVFSAEMGWLARWQGAEGATPEEAEFADAAAIAVAWGENCAAMRGRLATLDDDALDRAFAYTRRGQTFSYPLWTQLVHVVSHGTQHRSAVAAMLTALVRSPEDLDFSLFMRERGQK